MAERKRARLLIWAVLLAALGACTGESVAEPTAAESTAAEHQALAAEACFRFEEAWNFHFEERGFETFEGQAASRELFLDARDYALLAMEADPRWTSLAEDLDYVRRYYAGLPGEARTTYDGQPLTGEGVDGATDRAERTCIALLDELRGTASESG